MENKCVAILEALNKVILDKEKQLVLALSCILARGHLLIEDLPGMGKTTLAKAMSTVLGLDCKRVQFTADMLPGDLIGASIYNEKERNFEFHKGAVFTQMLLADEINRGSPRTQSALLEVMAEHQISADSITYQLDRFMMRIELGFPSRVEALRILRGENVSEILSPVLASPKDLVQMQNDAATVYAADSVLEYIMNLCGATRNDPNIPNSLYPRASLAILAASRAYAYVHGRDFVTPNDVQAIFPAVAEHRIRKGVVSLGNNPCSARILNIVNPLI